MSLDITLPEAYFDPAAPAWEQDRLLTGARPAELAASFGVAPALAAAWGVDATTARAWYETGVAKNAGAAEFAGALDINNRNLAPAWGVLEIARQAGRETPELLAYLQRYADEGDQAKEARNAAEKKAATGNLLKFAGLLAGVTLPGLLGLYPGQAAAATAAASGAPNVAQGFSVDKLGGFGLKASVDTAAPVSAGLGATGTGGITGLVAPPGFQLAPGVGSSLLDAVKGLRLPSPIGASSAASSPAVSTSAPSLSQVASAAGAAKTIAGAGASLAGVLGLASSSSGKPTTAHVAAGAQQVETVPAASPLGPLGVVFLAAAGVAVAVALAKRRK